MYWEALDRKEMSGGGWTGKRGVRKDWIGGMS